MKSRISRLAKLMSIGMFGVTLLGMGAEPASAAGFPTAACRPGYIQAGTRLCINEFEQNAAQFDTAMRLCRNQRGYVASYGDLFYLYANTALDAAFNPSGKWLGPDLVGDDVALCGNRNITANGDADINSAEGFETTCNKNDSRSYWCAHDDE